MYKSAILMGLFCVLASSLSAQDTLTVEQYISERSGILESLRAEADSAVYASLDEYEAWRFQFELDFNNFKDEMQRQWGDFKERDKTHWVEYMENGTVRWDVDFEEGEGTIEILADENDTIDSLRANMEETLLKLLESKGSPSEMPDDVDTEVFEEPILNGQLEVPENMDSLQFAEELAEEVELKEVQGEDGTMRTVAVLNLSLVPDHLRVRAEKFRREVELYSKKYDLDPSLVLAIIHTESFFNPMAKSHANALGLMQIVPRTAGRDVYRVLNGKDQIPSAEYLYNPDQNVHFGSTYIDILMNRYMRGIEDRTVHEYLVICAYNTGAGNVARAYINSTNFNKARDTINGMTAKENFDHLLANLPWDETKNYLKKVTERRSQYQQWMNTSP